MPVSRLSPKVLRAGAIALVLAIAACTGSPATPRKTTASASTAPTKVATASSPKTPSAVPSLGLLLQGRVTVDPSALLAGKLATTTATGVKLISDNGLGLISDNGLGLISDHGSGIVGNNAAGYHVAASASGLKPVEGMLVSAVGLYDGKVLAGPVATKADGSYQLGFVKTPERNLRIVATVPKHEKEAEYTYATLVPPSPAPVVTSDSTRVVAAFVLDLLPVLLQPTVDIAKQDPPPTLPPDVDVVTKGLADELYPMGPETLKRIDVDGAVAKGISSRLVAYADLKHVAFKELYDVVEEVRAFAETLPPETPSLLSKMQPMFHAGKDAELAAFFEDRGMETEKAADLAKRLLNKGHVVSDLLTLTLATHLDEIFGPISDLAK
jgi:hypothetical protein